MPRLPDEIRVTNRVVIPGSELSLAFARSGGPGGQHVNKTATKVVLRWNAESSVALNEADRVLLRKRLASRLTTEGDLLVTCETNRDQKRNIEEALARFEEIVRKAIQRPKPRKKTKPSRAAQQRRLDDKKRRSARKQDRRRPPD